MNRKQFDEFPHQPIPYNRIEFEHPDTPRALAAKIFGVMQIAECGLLTWFDARQSGRELEGAPQPPILAAFHPLSGIGRSMFPERVEQVMGRDWFRMLVWVGKNVIDATDAVHFTVTLAHELRHVEQFVFDRQIHYGGTVIMAILSRLPKAEWVRHSRFDSPVEWDAEARAREVSVWLHGESAVHDYFEKKAKEHHGFEPFVNTQPVPALPEVKQAVSDFLRPRINVVSEIAKRPKEAWEFRELARMVDWGALGLPDPTK